jgi:ABC-type lipoprotein release transport system permease subunit
LTGIDVGDYVTVRWRDINGMFDATDIQIVTRMNTTNPAMDNNQIWLPLDKLRDMLQAPGSATIVIAGKDLTALPDGDETWIFHSQDELLTDITDMIEAKSVGVSIFYILLLAMALLAIFDTQMLSIFRRRKEMGTLMALGMSRPNVIGLFTLEGGLHGFLALAVGAVYGIPFLAWQAKYGFPLPDVTDDFGMAIGSALYPSYGIKLLTITTLLVLVTVTFVSFLPTRKISKLKPTDALRGKLT